MYVRPDAKRYLYNGEELSLTQIAEYNNMRKTDLYYRVETKGMPLHSD